MKFFIALLFLMMSFLSFANEKILEIKSSESQPYNFHIIIPIALLDSENQVFEIPLDLFKSEKIVVSVLNSDYTPFTLNNKLDFEEAFPSDKSFIGGLHLDVPKTSPESILDVFSTMTDAKKLGNIIKEVNQELKKDGGLNFSNIGKYKKWYIEGAPILKKLLPEIDQIFSRDEESLKSFALNTNLDDFLSKQFKKIGKFSLDTYIPSISEKSNDSEDSFIFSGPTVSDEDNSITNLRSYSGVANSKGKERHFNKKSILDAPIELLVKTRDFNYLQVYEPKEFKEGKNSFFFYGLNSESMNWVEGSATHASHGTSAAFYERHKNKKITHGVVIFIEGKDASKVISRTRVFKIKPKKKKE